MSIDLDAHCIPANLRYLIDLVGADRTMLGTDYPFEAGDLDPLTTIDAIADLTDEERRLIVSSTAERSSTAGSVHRTRSRGIR